MTQTTRMKVSPTITLKLNGSFTGEAITNAFRKAAPPAKSDTVTCSVEGSYIANYVCTHTSPLELVPRSCQLILTIHKKVKDLFTHTWQENCNIALNSLVLTESYNEVTLEIYHISEIWSGHSLSEFGPESIHPSALKERGVLDVFMNLLEQFFVELAAK